MHGSGFWTHCKPTQPLPGRLLVLKLFQNHYISHVTMALRKSLHSRDDDDDYEIADF